MNKFTLIFLLAVSVLSGYSNDLKKGLQGTWLCIEILDENGQPTNGKYGQSDEYLKFNFNKSKLSITEAPFDPSLLGFTIKYGSNYIDLIPGSVYKIPEQVYYVKNVTEEKLILTTLNPSQDTIYYYFMNEKSFIEDFDPQNDIVDLGLIIIKHLKLENGNGTNRVSQYLIPNTREFLNPSPTFNDSRSASFGHYFSINFKFPDYFPVDSLTKKLIVDFDILKKDIENIKIIQGINLDFDQQVITIIEKTRKKWIPLEIDDIQTDCRVRFHFIFYLGEMEMVKFKN